MNSCIYSIALLYFLNLKRYMYDQGWGGYNLSICSVQNDKHGYTENNNIYQYLLTFYNYLFIV